MCFGRMLFAHCEPNTAEMPLGHEENVYVHVHVFFIFYYIFIVQNCSVTCTCMNRYCITS